MEIFDYLLAFFAAFVAGFIDAIIGGGGLITWPVVLGLGVPVSLAAGTIKLQAFMASISAIFSLRKQIEFKKLFLGIVFTAIFSVLGAFTLTQIPNDLLMPLVLAILIAVFIYTIFKPDIGELNSKARLKNSIFLIIFGAILGFYDGFIGPGTGSFWILAFVALLGLNMRQASIYTKVLNTTSCFFALMFFVIFYGVDYKLGFIMGVGGLIGGFLGAKLLLKVNISIIRKVFILVVFATICKLIYSEFF